MGGKGTTRYAGRMLVLVGFGCLWVFLGGDPDPFSGLKMMESHSTPQKFNIAPKNRQCQKETSLPIINFQGLC